MASAAFASDKVPTAVLSIAVACAPAPNAVALAPVASVLAFVVPSFTIVEPIATAPVSDAFVPVPYAVALSPVAVALVPVASAFVFVADAFGPMAIASVPVAPLLCLFGSTAEFTEKYFTPSAMNFSITAFTWEPLIASVESSAIRPAATFFN